MPASPGTEPVTVEEIFASAPRRTGPKPKIMLDVTEKECEYCTKTFVKKITGTSEGFSKQRFCSISCASKVIRKKKEIIDLRFVSRQRFRIAVREVFKDQCAVCGWNEASCDVAHIDASKPYNDIDNVVMLYPNHHRMYDQGFISKDEIMAARQNVEVRDRNAC